VIDWRSSAATATRRAVLALGAGAIAIAGLAEAAPSPTVQIDDPPPGKAVIVFYRKWLYPAALDSYIVREGKTALGRLSAGTYFVSVADPGLHTYTVHSERHEGMQLVVEAGEIYYVRFELETGFILYQPTLVPAEQRQFDESSGHLRLSFPLETTATSSVSPSTAASP
jgi:hypothetical protein